MALERSEEILVLARRIQRGNNPLTVDSKRRAKEIYDDSKRLATLPKNLNATLLQKYAYDLNGKQIFSDWKEKWEDLMSSCPSHLARIKALEIAHGGDTGKVIYHALKEKMQHEDYVNADEDTATLTATARYKLLLDAIDEVQQGRLGGESLKKDFEKGKQPKGMDCVAFWTDKRSKLRALKNLTPSYNDSVENFKKIYKKCLGSSSTAIEVKLMLNQFQFADGATTDEKFDAIKVMISTIAKNKADDSTSDDEEETSNKSRVGGIKGKECPFCARSYDAQVRANAVSCPGKDSVYEGRDRKGKVRLETDSCPKLKEWSTRKQGQNNRGNSGSGGRNRNGNSGNDRNKGFGKFKGNCHECGQWGHRAFECPNKGNNNNRGNGRRDNNRGSGKRKVSALKNQIKQLKKQNKKLKKRRNNNQGQGGGNGNHADNEDNNDSDSSGHDSD
eukprot:g7415.t1